MFGDVLASLLVVELVVVRVFGRVGFVLVGIFGVSVLLLVLLDVAFGAARDCVRPR